MAPEALRLKPREKQNFDDDLGDDFLSSWKPSKSLAALDFEDDELTPKKSKASFSLAKMDTNFDFDFTGGMNALSNFNVDISDLDLPSTRDKTSKAKGSSQEKAQCSSKKGDSKFSFQFKGFDEFDLDDALKTNKELEMSVHSKTEKKDCTPPSLGKKYGKKVFLDTSSDNISESTTMPNIGKSSTKGSQNDAKADPSPNNGKTLGGFTFSDDESSQHDPGFPRVDNQEETSDYCTPQKRKELDVKESAILAIEESTVPTPTHIDIGHDLGDTKQQEVVPVSQPEAECSRKSEDHTCFDKTNSMNETSSEMSSGPVLCGKESSKNEMEVDEVPPRKEDTQAPYNDTGTSKEFLHNVRKEQQKSLAIDLASRNTLSSDERSTGEGEKVSVKSMHEDLFKREPLELTNAAPKKSQPAEIGGTGRPRASLSPIQFNEAHALPGTSLQTQPDRMLKRKYSEEQRSRDSSSLKRESSKKLESDEVSSKVDKQQFQETGSVTQQKRCMELQTIPPEKRQQSSANLLSPRSGSKLAAVKFQGGGVPVNNTTPSPAIQAPRIPATGGNHSKLQEHGISVATLKFRLASSNDKPPEKKSTMLRGLQGLSLSPVLQQQSRSLYQINTTRKFPNASPFGKIKLGAEKQLENLTNLKTSNLSVLSKNKVLGASRRETCENAFKLGIASKGPVADPLTQLRTGVQTLRRVEDHEQSVLPATLVKGDCRGPPENVDTEEDCEEKLPLDILHKSDLGMADIQTVERDDNTDQATLQAENDGPCPYMVTEMDDGLYLKSENYANQLDQLVKELKGKYEEAMDLRARALVLNNTFLMLNNPIDEEKIRKIRAYVQEKLSPCRSLSVI